MSPAPRFGCRSEGRPPRLLLSVLDTSAACRNFAHALFTVRQVGPERVAVARPRLRGAVRARRAVGNPDHGK